MSAPPSRAPLWRAIAALAAIGIAFVFAYTSAPKLGLDLKGGTQIVLETQDGNGVEANSESTARALEILRGRVDALGVSEPTLARSGDRRIIIELPGVQDPREAAEVIGKTAQLTFHAVSAAGTEAELKAAQSKAQKAAVAKAAADAAESGEEPEGTAGQRAEDAKDAPQDTTKALVLPDEQGQPLKLSPQRLGGDDVSDATNGTLEQGVGTWVVDVKFAGAGKDAWTKLTGAAACFPDGDPKRRIAIVLDNEIISAPQVVTGGQSGTQCNVGQPGSGTQISGDFTQKSSKDLAVLIKGGALPVPVEVIEQRTVGPTLGEAAIDASIEAAIIGIALTGIFIIFVYRLMGLMATIALGSYALISYGMLVWLGATLTLPGLAGFVLAIGLAIDANVLVFERAREEYALRRGEGLAPSLDTGFRKAWSAIIDSNVTTLLAGGLLFFLASGPVKGFGVTLSIGVVASMVSALVVTRVIADFAVRRSFVKNRPAIAGLAGAGRLRQWLAESGPDIMKRSGLWVVVTLAVAVFAVGGIVVRGLNLGVEFTGGRVLEFSTSQSIDVDTAREAVGEAGFPSAVVQESSGSTPEQSNITVRTDQITNDEAVQIENSIADAAGDAQKERDELIGPSLGEELRNKAVIAFLIAVGAQMLYLAWRFRWTYAGAAVISMSHVVLTVTGIFAWWGKPIDGVFLAAILSIIGLAVNDTIVVFDRIRERTAEVRTRTLREVINEAILQTVPRTINTGLGAMFILAALAVLGGDSLTDFALALLIGLGFGIFSTIFTASAIAVLLEERWPVAPPSKTKKKVIDPYADIAAAGRESGKA